MKAILIKVVIGIIFTYFGYQLFDRGMTSPSATALEEYERLCKRSEKTIGIFESTYRETNIKILKGSSGTKLNTFKYRYTVNDQEYSGSFSTTGMPAKPTIDVWYDPSNPDSHMTNNPCKQYEYSKSKKYPGWYTWVGLPLLLMGIGSLYGLLKNGIRTLVGGNKKPQISR